MQNAMSVSGRCLGIGMWAVALTVLPGCSVTESTNVKTSGIWANLSVSQDGDSSVHARGTLRVGGATGTIVDLAGGEYLEVNGVRMHEWVEPITNYHWNTADIPADPDGEYTITFVRTDEQVSTTMVMPEQAYALDVSTVLYSGDRVTVYWDDPEVGGSVEVRVDGECVEYQSHSVDSSPGEFTTSPITDASVVPLNCPIAVGVTRSVGYSVNSAFQAGSAGATRYTTIPYDFESTLP